MKKIADIVDTVREWKDKETGARHKTTMKEHRANESPTRKMKLTDIIQECHRNLDFLRKGWIEAEPHLKDFWMARMKWAWEELHHYMSKRKRAEPPDSPLPPCPRRR